MPTILLTSRYQGRPLDIIQSVVPEGFSLLMVERIDSESLLKGVPEADYLLASGRLQINEDVLAPARRLKMIQRTGVGLDSIDLDAARRYGVRVYVNRGINAESVAEHALLLMLAAMRRLPSMSGAAARGGVWKRQEWGVEGRELRGKTVGLIGLGSIGRTLAGLLCGFHVKLLYSDPIRQTEDSEHELGLTYVPLEKLLEEADIISLHVPLSPQTRHMIGQEHLSLMKKDAVLVNTARGGLIDEYALAERLRAGEIAFACLDVFEREPISKYSPLYGLENLIATPHIGGITEDSFRRMMEEAMNNIRLFEKGEWDAVADKRLI
jgi:phosphoglycerate dehydrogenase-like enzyme